MIFLIFYNFYQYWWAYNGTNLNRNSTYSDTLTATIKGYPETSGDIFDIWQFNHNYLNYIIGKKFLQQTDSFDFTIVGSLLAVVLYNRRFGAEKNYKIG